MAFIAEVIVLDSIGFMTCLSVVGEGGCRSLLDVRSLHLIRQYQCRNIHYPRKAGGAELVDELDAGMLDIPLIGIGPRAWLSSSAGSSEDRERLLHNAEPR
jgi:hypothetical protein